MIEKCVVCGEDIPDYEPMYCCDDLNNIKFRNKCGCLGKPINPPICSNKCDELFLKGYRYKDDKTLKSS